MERKLEAKEKEMDRKIEAKVNELNVSEVLVGGNDGFGSCAHECIYT